MTAFFEVRWTPEKIAILQRCYEEKKTDAEIQEELGQQFSIKSICSKRHRLGLVSESRSKSLAEFKARKIMALPKPEFNVFQANIWHLIDLKRAGHSPRNTELAVVSDGVTYRASAALAAGLATSPAAICAE